MNNHLMPIAGSAAVIAFAALMAGCQPPPEGELLPPPPTVMPATTTKAPPDLYPVTLTDSRGTSVTFEAQPQRIVSMMPPLTEILFALGLGDHVVGVTTFCTYPAEAREKEKIGDTKAPSVEKIISLDPDVAFAMIGNPESVIASLLDKGVRVFAFDPKSYAETCESIEMIGKICGAQDKAAAVADQMRSVAEEIEQKVAGLPADKRPSALFVVWLDPLHVAGPGTYMGDMLNICGARNAAPQTKNAWKQFSLEVAVAADPEVLVLTTEHTPGAGDAEAKLRELRESEHWRGVSAVKNERIVMIQADLVCQTGPRLAEGLKQIAVGIHPDLYQD